VRIRFSERTVSLGVENMCLFFLAGVALMSRPFAAHRGDTLQAVTVISGWGGIMLPVYSTIALITGNITINDESFFQDINPVSH